MPKPNQSINTVLSQQKKYKVETKRDLKFQQQHTANIQYNLVIGLEMKNEKFSFSSAPVTVNNPLSPDWELLLFFVFVFFIRNIYSEINQ